jgi:hypothetical protein
MLATTCYKQSDKLRQASLRQQMGGSVKAERLGDGEWANHRQAALDDATQGICHFLRGFSRSLSNE